MRVSKNTGEYSSLGHDKRKYYENVTKIVRLREERRRMEIRHEDMDALDLIKDIKAEMNKVRNLIGALEYVIYQKDDRVEINFFERGEHDKEGSKE